MTNEFWYICCIMFFIIGFSTGYNISNYQLMKLDELKQKVDRLTTEFLNHDGEIQELYNFFEERYYNAVQHSGTNGNLFENLPCYEEYIKSQVQKS